MEIKKMELKTHEIIKLDGDINEVYKKYRELKSDGFIMNDFTIINHKLTVYMEREI